MNFRIRGLSPEPFKAMFQLDDAELVAHGAQRVFADDSTPGYPCRVSLAHATPGENRAAGTIRRMRRLMLIGHE